MGKSQNLQHLKLWGHNSSRDELFSLTHNRPPCFDRVMVNRHDARRARARSEKSRSHAGNTFLKERNETTLGGAGV